MGTVTIRFGGYQPPDSVHSRAAAVFGAALRDRLDAPLDDAVRFEFEGDITATGHKAADLLAMVESGALDMCYFASSYLAERVPALELLDLPFTITDRAQAYRLLDGELGALLTARIGAATGYRVLGYWDNGFRHFSNDTRPIHTPADCQGLRIRTLSSALHQRSFAMLGFEPVALDVRELRDAVANGRVEAQENPLTTLHVFGLHEHHRHVTLSGHFFGAALLLCNAAAYARWPEVVRHTVDAAAAEATAAQRGFAAAADDTVLAALRQAGNTVTALTPAETRGFADAVAPLIAEQREKHGAALFALLS